MALSSASLELFQAFILGLILIFTFDMWVSVRWGTYARLARTALPCRFLLAVNRALSSLAARFSRGRRSNIRSKEDTERRSISATKKKASRRSTQTHRRGEVLSAGSGPCEVRTAGASGTPSAGARSVDVDWGVSSRPARGGSVHNAPTAALAEVTPPPTSAADAIQFTFRRGDKRTRPVRKKGGPLSERFKRLAETPPGVDQIGARGAAPGLNPASPPWTPQLGTTGVRTRSREGG